jgi:hypothetical protein
LGVGLRELIWQSHSNIAKVKASMSNQSSSIEPVYPYHYGPEIAVVEYLMANLNAEGQIQNMPNEY